MDILAVVSVGISGSFRRETNCKDKLKLARSAVKLCISDHKGILKFKKNAEWKVALYDVTQYGDVAVGEYGVFAREEQTDKNVPLKTTRLPVLEVVTLNM
jgi:hypothetical protein